MLLVPFVGYVALLAWQRRVFESARSEGPLPDASLDTRGAGPTVAALALLVALPGIPMAVVAALLKLTHHRISGFLPPELLEPILTVYAITLYPELLRRALAHREGFALLRPGASIAAIASAPLEYAATVLGMLCAVLVLAVGLNCCVGAILSIPLAHAIAAHQVARWQACVEARAKAAAGPYR